MSEKPRDTQGRFTRSNPGGPSKEKTPKDIRDLIRKMEDGHLDRRRRMAKLIEEGRELLGVCDPEEIAVQVLEHDIATNLAIERVILEHANEREDLIDESGQLIPALSTNLLKYQEAKRKSLIELNRIYARRREEDRADKMTRDVADIILDDQGGDNEDDE